ncbi:MAG TPA: response regulator [Kofleriaceae bacterium]|nr:response regulator [Kofleriaceae bacterium]
MIARVLVVDDDDHIRRALSTALTRAGFDVTTADDGRPAIELGGPFELVVVDYNMKTVTGAEVVRYYKQRFGKLVYCAVLSGDDDDATRAACLEAGADDVFSKPASPIALRQRLIEAAAQLRAG